jgi:hypothetical protein
VLEPIDSKDLLAESQSLIRGSLQNLYQVEGLSFDLVDLLHLALLLLVCNLLHHLHKGDELQLDLDLVQLHLKLRTLSIELVDNLSHYSEGRLACFQVTNYELHIGLQKVWANEYLNHGCLIVAELLDHPVDEGL